MYAMAIKNPLNIRDNYIVVHMALGHLSKTDMYSSLKYN